MANPPSASATLRALQDALALHRAGKLREAEAAYASILAAQPRNGDALRLRGIALRSLGRGIEAVAILREAIAVDPASADAHCALADVLLAQQSPLEAVPYFETALKLRPDFFEALCNFGNALGQLHRWKEACDAYVSAVRLRPSDAVVRRNLTVALRQVGQFTEAIEQAEQAVSLAPNSAAAHNALGVALKLARDDARAIDAYRRAITLDCHDPEPAINLGLLHRERGEHTLAQQAFTMALAKAPGSLVALFGMASALHSAGDWELAVAAYERCLAVEPSNPKVWRNIAAIRQKQQRWGDAIDALRQVAQNDPSPEPRSNLAACLLESGRLDEAEQVARDLVTRHPEFALGWTNLASVLNRLGRPREGEQAARTALRWSGEFAEAHNNLGMALAAQGQYDEAAGALRRAVALKPEFALAKLNAAMVDLTLGNFDAGWAGYDIRFEAIPAVASVVRTDLPRWRGEFDLRDRTLLVRAEQGLGDTIQFSRYLPLLRRRGTNVVFEAQPSLRRLFTCADIGAIIGSGESCEQADCYVPLLSLPQAFATTAISVPPPLPIAVPSNLLAARAAQFSGSGRRRIGVVWSGNPIHPNDRNRSIPLEAFRPIFQADRDSHFYSLKKDLTERESAMLVREPNVTNIGSSLLDFLDAASVVASLDLVITVDTAVAHLAGTLGKPVWILLPFAPDWRWLLGRSDSPWYPTARLFRQPAIADWEPVVEVVVEKLRAP